LGLVLGVGDFHAHAVLDHAVVIDADIVDVEGDQVDIAWQNPVFAAGRSPQTVGRPNVGEFKLAGLGAGCGQARDQRQGGPHGFLSSPTEREVSQVAGGYASIVGTSLPIF